MKNDGLRLEILRADMLVIGGGIRIHMGELLLQEKIPN